jgi:FkbM family methyltransferase
MNKYSSQFGQDKWLRENLFPNKDDGNYIEIGSHDGVTINNTLYFENLGWSGLCIEPIPDIYEQLKANRKHAICAAAWKETCHKKFTRIRGYSEMLSGLSESFEEQHKFRIGQEVAQYNQEVEEFDVLCLGINRILELQNAENGLDLLSMDIEGGEAEVIKAIDFDKFKPFCIMFENNYNDESIRMFLLSKGYEFKTRLTIDDVFVKV